MPVVAEMPNVINVSDFALASTLECGQAFRWSRTPDGWFEGVVGKEVWQLRQRNHDIEWKVVSPISHRPTPPPVSRYL